MLTAPDFGSYNHYIIGTFNCQLFTLSNHIIIYKLVKAIQNNVIHMVIASLIMSSFLRSYPLESISILCLHMYMHVNLRMM